MLLCGKRKSLLSTSSRGERIVVARFEPRRVRPGGVGRGVSGGQEGTKERPMQIHRTVTQVPRVTLKSKLHGPNRRVQVSKHRQIALCWRPTWYQKEGTGLRIITGKATIHVWGIPASPGKAGVPHLLSSSQTGIVTILYYYDDPGFYIFAENFYCNAPREDETPV